MTSATIVELEDVAGKPRVKMDLPSPLRIGDKLTFNFRVARQHTGRSEVLDVKGEFRVSQVSFDVTSGPARQILVVVSNGVPPAWRAVKKASPPSRKLGPAKAPRMALE